jgi:phosphoglucosamine mutase
MPRRLFGTDGVRGVAGEEPMTVAFALRLGHALGADLNTQPRGAPRPHAVIGRDPRASGGALAAALTAGLCAGGVDVHDLGVTPTAAVAHAIRSGGAAAGVMVSASHNPFDDNGLKVFGADGAKLSDEAERMLESRLAEAPAHARGDAFGRVTVDPDAAERYVDALLAHAPDLSGLAIGIDAAHGAAFALAPAIFERAGARIETIGCAPDGCNVNDGVGSTHPNAIAAFVRERGLDLGIAFDGDADRAILCDHRGRILDGDAILAICALARGERTIVATQMTNLGIERFLAQRGIGLLRVAVGDRYVHEALQAHDLRLGGEQSGHVLFRDLAGTGDGILTALQTLAATRALGEPLAHWAEVLPRYPQRLVNVRCDGVAASDVLADPDVAAAQEGARRALGDGGRLLVRRSGTEPLVRVMVEAERSEQVASIAAAVADAVRIAATRLAVRA